MCFSRAAIPFLILYAVSLQAQIVSGTIVGRLMDASGAVVPSAAVTATNEATGASRTTTSDDSGNYAFPQLPPGTYAISATATGFKKYQLSAIDLAVDQTVRADVHFQVGEISQQIEIRAAGAQVEGETSELGQVIESTQVVQLPLNGRNFMQLANISSGTAPAYNARSATITNQSGRSDLAVHISGGRGDANSYLIDGVETRSTWFNSPSVLLSVDAINEFKIQKNSFAAEYGQGSGIMSLVSKSGANDIHGSAYEFLRNSDLDAANFFDNFFSRPKAPFRQPIWPDSGRSGAEKQAVLFWRLGIDAQPEGEHTQRVSSNAGATFGRPHWPAVFQGSDSRPGHRSAVPRKSHSGQPHFQRYPEIYSVHSRS
jgi:hypothetical protein